MNKNNFHYVTVLLDMLYGIEMEDEDIEELGLLAWERIGNKNTRLYRYTTCPDSENSITLPCNAVSIEGVTTSYEDDVSNTNYSSNGDYTKSFIETRIENSKMYNSPYYSSGKLIKYDDKNSKIWDLFKSYDWVTHSRAPLGSTTIVRSWRMAY